MSDIRELIYECPVGHRTSTVVDLSKPNWLDCPQCRPYYAKLEAVADAAMVLCDSYGPLDPTAVITLATQLLELDELIREKQE